MAMPSIVGLYVAISEGEGVFKHWALFIDGPTNQERIVLQVEGSSTRFRFERKISNARTSSELLELIPLCDVPTANIAAIDHAAGEAPIHNEHPGYNCQDYVLELLDEIEARGLVDGGNMEYKKQKAHVNSKQEGLQ